MLRGPGTNCDEETAFALERAGASCELAHLSKLSESPGMLKSFGILVLPGGFTYGDDVAAGKVFAVKLMARLEEPLRAFIERGGLVVGICNGFQILIKSGFLPGPEYGGPGEAATLTFNESGRFEDRWVSLRVEECRATFLKPLAGRIVAFPVAHGEGRFVAADRRALDRIESDRLVAFRYVGPKGEPDPKYPWDPNGSMNCIAGICDPTGRVLGLMPHPERHALPWQHPRWTREGLDRPADGAEFFAALVREAKGS